MWVVGGGRGRSGRKGVVERVVLWGPTLAGGRTTEQSESEEEAVGEVRRMRLRERTSCVGGGNARGMEAGGGRRSRRVSVVELRERATRWTTNARAESPTICDEGT